MKSGIEIGAACIRCGRCVRVCPEAVLVSDAVTGAVRVDHLCDCIACGQCAAACPTGTLEHSLFPKERIHPFRQEDGPTAEQVLWLCRKRRSNRTFSRQSVPEEWLRRMVEAGAYAPTAHNARDVRFTVVSSPEKLQRMVDFTLETYRRAVRILTHPLVRPVLTLLHNGYYKNLPTMRTTLYTCRDGRDTVLRGAAAVILIHTDSDDFFGSENANLAYQNMSLMAESLGAGHFYTGHLCAALKLRPGRLEQSLHIDGRIRAVMAVGLPTVKFSAYVERKEEYEEER
ncbi:MAG: nitroreductase family protein [Paraprevotella sp.]|nr:nitroreductase family protein [Paraprevotella sp.]